MADSHPERQQSYERLVVRFGPFLVVVAIFLFSVVMTTLTYPLLRPVLERLSRAISTTGSKSVLIPVPIIRSAIALAITVGGPKFLLFTTYLGIPLVWVSLIDMAYRAIKALRVPRFNRKKSVPSS